VTVLIGLTVISAVALVLLKRRARSETAGMRVVGRLALEPRRSIYVVEIGARRFMVGVGDGPMTMLGEVELPSLTKQDVAAETLQVMAGGKAS
jgi:flagellar biogenesis protein FliO